MAILKNSNYETIGSLDYRFVHVSEYTIRSPLNREPNPKVEVVIKTLDYTINERGERMVLNGSDKTYILGKRISELVLDMELSIALNDQEEAFIKLLNYLNGDSNLSYESHFS